MGPTTGPTGPNQRPYHGPYHGPYQRPNQALDTACLYVCKQALDTAIQEALSRQVSFSNPFIAPPPHTHTPFFYMAHKLDLRCGLVPTPWMLGPQHVSIRPRL